MKQSCGCAGAKRPARGQRPSGKPHQQTERDQSRRREGGEPGASVLGPSCGGPRRDRDDHHDHADTGESEQPRRLRVAARAEAVDQGDRPRRVGGPVSRPPRPVAQSATDHARQGNRDQKVEGDRAEAEPHGAIARAKRHNHVHQPNRRESVEHRRPDVHEQERDGQQRGVAVHGVDHEARDPRRPRPADVQHSERDRQRQQDKGDRARPAGQVPERGGVHEPPETTGAADADAGAGACDGC